MPVVSKFYGIIIKMYFSQREHQPPHFHAIYGEFNGVFEIASLKMLEGDLPRRAERLVREWAENIRRNYNEFGILKSSLSFRAWSETCQHNRQPYPAFKQQRFQNQCN